MGKESARCKVRDDSACEQNGESPCFRVSPRQPQGQLSGFSLLLLPVQTSPHPCTDIPTSLHSSWDGSGHRSGLAALLGLNLLTMEGLRGEGKVQAELPSHNETPGY